MLPDWKEQFYVFCPVIISQLSLCVAEEIWGLLFMTHNGRVAKSLWLWMCTKVVETSRTWANVPSSSPPYSAGTVHPWWRWSRMVRWPSRPDHRFPKQAKLQGCPGLVQSQNIWVKRQWDVNMWTQREPVQVSANP